jgi:hypothetical protein
VTNRLHPRFGDITVAEARRRATRAEQAGRSDEAALWSNLTEMRGLADAEREVLAPLLERTTEGISIEIPLLPTDVHDLEALEHIAEHLAPA